MNPLWGGGGEGWRSGFELKFKMMKAVEIYQNETGIKIPDNQIEHHQWHIEYVKWLEEKVEKNISSQPLLVNDGAKSVVQSIYDAHKLKLNILKENRAKSEEEKWTDAEIKSADDQITILASVLSDLYRKVIDCN